MKVLMDKKESRIASSWVFIYCIRSQWQSGALTWSHRDWQMVTTSWQEKQRERQEKNLSPPQISVVPESLTLLKITYLTCRCSQLCTTTPAQLQARHERCSPFSEPALQCAQYFQGNYVTRCSKINAIIKQHHMSLPSSWKHSIHLLW